MTTRRKAILEELAPTGMSIDDLVKASGYKRETVHYMVGHDPALKYYGLRATAKRPAIPAELVDEYRALTSKNGLRLTAFGAANSVLKGRRK